MKFLYTALIVYGTFGTIVFGVVYLTSEHFKQFKLSHKHKYAPLFAKLANKQILELGGRYTIRKGWFNYRFLENKYWTTTIHKYKYESIQEVGEAWDKYVLFIQTNEDEDKPKRIYLTREET